MKAFRWPLRYVPRVETAGRFPMPASSSGRVYLHNTAAFHQHLYDGKIIMGRTTHSFRAGDVTITPPGVESIYQLSEGGHHWCIHFAMPRTPAPGHFLTLPLILPLTGGDAVHLRERLRNISDALRPRTLREKEVRFAAADAGTLFQSLLLFLARKQTAPLEKVKTERRSDVLLDNIKERLDNEFQHPFRVHDLAAASGLSRNFFALRFRERFGTTVDGYLLHLRIEMARNLLLSTDQPIKTIAFECGIADSNYFNKQFRRVTGLSPSAYRAQNHGEW